MSMSYAINGKFVGEPLGGIQRYASEILYELDPMVGDLDLQLIVPEGLDAPVYRNIEVVHYGTHGGIRWEQRDFGRYLKKTGRSGVNLCNTMPLSERDGLIVIHDVSYKVNPQFFTGARNRASRIWHCKQYAHAVKSAAQIVTVSEFSRDEIRRTYHTENREIPVIYNAWQHMDRVEGEPALEKYDLRNGSYFFTLSSLAPNKNTAWIIETARLMPEAKFVIAGSSALTEAFSDAPANVLFPGRVSDGEAKSLMAQCRAFLFPTFYEGFGIPPLEALACGAPQIVISDTPCMHEIFGDAATYINPDAPASIACAPMGESERDAILSRYSWKASAVKLRSLLRDMG